MACDIRKNVFMESMIKYKIHHFVYWDIKERTGKFAWQKVQTAFWLGEGQTLAKKK